VDIAALLHAHGKRRHIKPPLQARLLSIERRAVISARMTGWVDRPQAALVYVRRMSSSVA
jgi:hypothetical protein